MQCELMALDNELQQHNQRGDIFTVKQTKNHTNYIEGITCLHMYTCVLDPENKHISVNCPSPYHTN